mgnify:CR=1 FL=1
MYSNIPKYNPYEHPHGSSTLRKKSSLIHSKPVNISNIKQMMHNGTGVKEAITKNDSDS